MLQNGFIEAKQLLEHEASMHVWLNVMKLLVSALFSLTYNWLFSQLALWYFQNL